MNNSIITNGKAYPEITREKTKNGYRITMQTAKIFLFANGYISENDLNNPECDYTTITTGIYKAFCDGKLSLNATKQDGISNYTPIRVSTGLSGKLDTVFAVTTISLVNQFCLSRMLIDELVCSKCYVPESLRIDGILAFAQNMYVLTHFDLTEKPDWIPVMRADWAKKRIEKGLKKAQKDRKIDISDEEISDIVSQKPLCRFESMGDLACSLQAKNYLTIAKSNFSFDFALWTKNPAVLAFAIDSYGKPANLATVLSMSRKNEMDKQAFIDRYRKYFNHMFVVADSDHVNELYQMENAYRCHCEHFSCIRCRHCYDHENENIDTAVEKLREKKLK